MSLPSHDDTTYKSIDIMAPILKLFIFKINNNVVLSDIKQVFLMTGLRDEFDL